MVLKDLMEAGFLIIEEKSTFTLQSIMEFLGQNLNSMEGTLNLPLSKRRASRKEVGKFLKLKLATPRKVASILGVVKSGLAGLTALRAFSDLLVNFVNQHMQVGWDVPLIVPDVLHEQIRGLKGLLMTWPGRPFLKTKNMLLLCPSIQIHWTLPWAGYSRVQGSLFTNFGERKGGCTYI